MTAVALPGPLPEPLTGGEARPWPAASLAARTVLALSIAAFLSYLDRQLIAIFAPAIKARLAISDLQLSLLQGMAFSIFFAVAGVPLGKLVDRAHRWRIVTAGLVVWSLATIGCGLSTSFPAFFAARMLVGAGEACLLPAAVSLLADVLPRARRGRAMGMILTGSAIGMGLSTFVGGLGLAVLGGAASRATGLEAWQLTYIAVGMPGLVVAALVALFVTEPERRAPEAGPPLVEVRDEVWRNILAHRRFLLPAYCAFGIALVLAYGLGAWVPTMFLREFHASPLEVGATLGTIQIGMGIGSPLFGGWISDLASKRDPARGRLRLVFACFAAIVPLSVALALTAGAMRATIPIYALLLLAYSVVSVTAVVILQEAVPERMRGQVIAVYTMVTSIGGFGLGPLVVAFVTDIVLGDPMKLRLAMSLVAGTGALVAMAIMATTLLRRPQRP